MDEMVFPKAVPLEPPHQSPLAETPVFVILLLLKLGVPSVKLPNITTYRLELAVPSCGRPSMKLFRTWVIRVLLFLPAGM
jgi:hypothetical protein